MFDKHLEEIDLNKEMATLLLLSLLPTWKWACGTPDRLREQKERGQSLGGNIDQLQERPQSTLWFFSFGEIKCIFMIGGF